MSRVIKYSPLNREENQPIEIKRVDSFQPLEKTSKPDDVMDATMHDVKKEAESILEKAKREAEERLKKAERAIEVKRKELMEKESSIDQQIETARNTAASEGYEAGYSKGTGKAEQDYSGALDEVNRILASAQAHYHKKVQESEPEIVQLSIEIAGKIVGEKLTFEDSWKQYIKESMKQVKGEEDIKLFVSPKFYESTSTLIKEMKKQFNTDIVIYPNDSKQDSVCVIETKYGKIDASVDSQLNEIKEKLLELVGEENGHHTSVNCRQ